MHSPCILIVDQDPFGSGRLEAFLEKGGYRLQVLRDQQVAWERLESAPDRHEVIILGRGMAHGNALELLGRIKRHPVLQGIPVILETAPGAREEIMTAIQAGAWYCLAQPFDEALLGSVLGAAIEDRGRYRRLQEGNCLAGRALDRMHEGRFYFRTLEAARDIATVLAGLCPDPARAVIGLAELLINAVEHGNLGISYAEKSHLCDERRWDEEVARRLADPRYANREVEVRYRRGPAAIEVVIRDQGEGFHWQPYLEMDPDRGVDTHGRGIALSRRISFDRIEYRAGGREVVACIGLRHED